MPKAKKTNQDATIKQITDLTEALKIERADAINLRRRHEEEVTNLRLRVKASVIRELLPVIDNLDRALKHTPEDLQSNPYVQGVEGVVKQFEKILSDMGVERIKTVGEAFDPRLHEAVSTVEGESDQEMVVEELQAGYIVNGEVIRHAMVKVSM